MRKKLLRRHTSSVGDGTGAKSLSGSWRSEEQNSFGRVDAQVDEPLRMQKRDFDDFPKLVDLLFASSNVSVRHVRLLLDLE